MKKENKWEQVGKSVMKWENVGKKGEKAWKMRKKE